MGLSVMARSQEDSFALLLSITMVIGNALYFNPSLWDNAKR
jgi:hypothetical protein